MRDIASIITVIILTVLILTMIVLVCTQTCEPTATTIPTIMEDLK